MSLWLIVVRSLISFAHIIIAPAPNVSAVGQVLKLRFSSSFNTIMWDPPPTADGALKSHLSYQLTVINVITGQVIVSTTTTDTSYALPRIAPCQEYSASVTASSTVHQGESVVISQRSPGGELLKLVSVRILIWMLLNPVHAEVYKVVNVSQEVVVNNELEGNPSFVAVIFRVELQVCQPSPPLVYIVER